MGRRGPKPVDLPALKVNAVQWTYLLFGLRDGYPDLLQRMQWGPWSGKRKQLRAGRAEHIQFARVIPQSGGETAALVFSIARMFARRNRPDDKAELEYPVHQTIERDLTLPQSWQFGLKPLERPSLFFPILLAQPQLWEELKRSEERRVGKECRSRGGEEE